MISRSKAGLASLRAEGVPLAAILAAMGAAAGTDVVIKGRLDGKVRDAFAGLPLQRAFERVVGDLPHLMIYNRGADAPHELRVYGSTSRGGVAMPRSANEGGAPRDVAEAPEGQRLNTARRLNTLMRKELRAARETARAALAGDSGDLTSIVADLAAEDPNVRRRAIQALAQIGNDRAAEMLGGALQVEREPGLRRLALAALSRLDEPTARSLLEAAPASPGSGERKEKAPWGPGGSSNR